jgi:cytochrome o ubiquinol oxidase subunit IV
MNHASSDSGLTRGTFKSYTAGFVLALVLTAIPFYLVMRGTLSNLATLAAIFGAASAQILVHLHYFLHLDASSRARGHVLSMLFALVVMFLVIGGSVWIMYNLNYRMM